MRVAVIGTGYVGLVSAVCFAEMGHEVRGVDVDAAKVARLQAGSATIFEPGLEELLQRNVASGRLHFTTDLAATLPHVDIVFAAVATPMREDHHADLAAVERVTDALAQHLTHDLIVVMKSTVPVGTGRACEERLRARLVARGVPHQVTVVSNPEFLREGSAVADTLRPDRIILGLATDAPSSVRVSLEELYHPLTRDGVVLRVMDRESAELVKYASNAFLATKISFINMVAELCEVVGADVRSVAQGMGLDPRIGERFLQAGIGYGGSCFPKDVKAILATARSVGVELDLVAATDAVNARQRQRFIDHLLHALPAGARVAVWGLAFKPNTDDVREAPSLDVLPALVQAGHVVVAYDPYARDTIRPLLPPQVQLVDDALVALDGADALVLLTEWEEFLGLDLMKVTARLRGRDVFDGRLAFDPVAVRAAGLRYHGIGLPQQA
jgi:UDPglucose 6-dehydrogenase